MYYQPPVYAIIILLVQSSILHDVLLGGEMGRCEWLPSFLSIILSPPLNFVPLPLSGIGHGGAYGVASDGERQKRSIHGRASRLEFTVLPNQGETSNKVFLPLLYSICSASYDGGDTLGATSVPQLLRTRGRIYRPMLALF